MNKIDLIIDALEKAKDGWQSFDEYEKALTAARELRELKPIAWAVEPELGDSYVDCITPAEHDRLEGEYVIPLYALDEVTK